MAAELVGKGMEPEEQGRRIVLSVGPELCAICGHNIFSM